MAHDFKNYPELTNEQMQLYYFESPHKQITEDFMAEVVRVIDGDTIRVYWEERDFDFPVRLLDISAPEKKETGGKESKKWLEQQILGEEVEVKILKEQRVDKYGRLLGWIMFQGVNINEMSIIAGKSIPWRDRTIGNIPDLNKLFDIKWR